MKTVLRIFNLIIMALAGVAAAFLFMPPVMSFNSNIAISTTKFAEFVPNTTYTEDIDIVSLLGTDSIHVGVQFSLNMDDVKAIMGGSRERINECLINKSVNDIVSTFHEPIDLITEYSVKSIMRSTIKDQIKQQVQAGIDNYEEKSGQTVPSTAEEIMEESGMDDTFFQNFTLALYDALNADGATVESASNVLYQQIDEALAMAEDTEMVDSSSFGDETKTTVQNNLVSILTELKLIYDGNKIKKISEVAYVYLSDFVKTELNGKVDPSELEQQATETNGDYADRLLNLYVITLLAQTPAIYDVISYTTYALYIGLFVFAALWALLIIITLIKTFTKKPWTVFGPWFWIIGGLQLVLGIGLTVLGKIVLPRIDISALNLPLTSVVLAPRTYALIPSIIFGACIVIAFVYGFFKRSVKRSIKEENK